MPYIIFLVGICGAVLVTQFKEGSELFSAVSGFFPSFTAISELGGLSSFYEMFLWPMYFVLLLIVGVSIPFIVSTLVHFFCVIKRVSNGSNQT